MAYKTPDQIAVAAVASGEKKANLPVGKMLVGGFLAGAYIAFAGLLAVDVTAGLDPRIWGGVTTLLTGAVFSLGLVLVIVAGSELLTGNMALVPMAVYQKRVTIGRLGLNWSVILVANFLGALFVAYVLAVQAGVIGTSSTPAGTAGASAYTRLASIATGKAVTEDNATIFLRGIGCNWLVCLGVWMAMAAEDIAGNVAAIFFPITAFVALGFDHIVANMFFLPAAHFAGVPDIGWGDILRNLLFAGLGNAIGGSVFVGLAYWYLYLKGGAAVKGATSGTSDAAGTTGAPRTGHS